MFLMNYERKYEAIVCLTDFVNIYRQRPAPPGWTHNNKQLWHDATYDVFENRSILPVSDWPDECCFAGIRETFVQQLQVRALVGESRWTKYQG